MVGMVLVLATSSKLPIQKQIDLGLRGFLGDNIASGTRLCLVVDVWTRHLPRDI